MNILILAAVSCYGLSQDQMNYCFAREKHDVGFCYSIFDPSLRTTCRAEIERSPGACDGITNIDERQLCRNKASN